VVGSAVQISIGVHELYSISGTSALCFCCLASKSRAVRRKELADVAVMASRGGMESWREGTWLQLELVNTRPAQAAQFEVFIARVDRIQTWRFAYICCLSVCECVCGLKAPAGWVLAGAHDQDRFLSKSSANLQWRDVSMSRNKVRVACYQ
jgi:hypothetical protein